MTRTYAELRRAAKQRKSRRRVPNSTFSVVSRKPVQRKRKPIQKVNVDAEAKRRARYKVKLAAYRKSETYKLVEARAGGQCEAMDTREFVMNMATGQSGWRTVPPYRCDASKLYEKWGHRVRLTHHHLSYRRFGGTERPEDVIVLCDRHNAEAESQHPTRKRNYLTRTGK